MSVGNAAIVGVIFWLAADGIYDALRERWHARDFDPAHDRMRAAMRPSEPPRTGFWTPTKERRP